MRFPTIHLNGTSGGDLLEANLRTLHKIREAQRAVDTAAPNARDFYVQDEASAFAEAAEAHNAVYRLLMQASEHFDKIVTDLTRQIDEREEITKRTARKHGDNQ